MKTYNPIVIKFEIPRSKRDVSHQLWLLCYKIKNPYWLGRVRWNRFNYKYNIRGLYKWKWYEIINPFAKPRVKMHGKK